MEPAIENRRARGSAIVIAMLLTVLLFLLGAALLATAQTEYVIAANDKWGEGSFPAAEAAVQVSINQLSVDQVDQVVPETDLGPYRVPPAMETVL